VAAVALVVVLVAVADVVALVVTVVDTKEASAAAVIMKDLTVPLLPQQIALPVAIALREQQQVNAASVVKIRRASSVSARALGAANPAAVAAVIAVVMDQELTKNNF